jgi:hypothetical protein
MNEKNGSSVLTRVLTGVVTALLISSMLFGMSVYGFIADGPYVEQDVYEIQQKYIIDELEDLNYKMDLIIREKLEDGN